MKSKISKQVLILGMVSLFTDIASEMLYPVTPIFLTTVLGSSMALVGVIEGVAEVTAGLLK
ncbi:MAG TPA: MFS transporter, partial [Ignavibacteriaceae bacterium]